MNCQHLLGFHKQIYVANFPGPVRVIIRFKAFGTSRAPFLYILFQMLLNFLLKQNQPFLLVQYSQPFSFFLAILPKIYLYVKLHIYISHTPPVALARGCLSIIGYLYKR